MNRFYTLLLTALLLILGSQVFASGDQPVASKAKASITGKVIDNKTGESLAGVAVCIEGTQLKAYTDLDGAFEINNLDPGSYNLVLSLISYKNSLVENLKLNASDKGVIDIKLNAIR